MRCATDFKKLLRPCSRSQSKSIIVSIVPHWMLTLSVRLLKEAKSELVLARKRRKMLMKVTKHMAYVSFFLIAAREICKGGFSDNILNELLEKRTVADHLVG